MPSTSSAASAITTLAEYRRLGLRKSAETLALGSVLYGTKNEKRLGDDLWSFLEQHAIAALDLGRFELAEDAIVRLATRFPQSPRVSALEGMLLEARGDLAGAKELYDSLLAEDETNVTILKRQIALAKLMHPKDPSVPIGLLTSYLDTFYSDPEAWLELADLYSALPLYPQTLFALEEAILLQPQNPFHLLRYAETLYTSGDIPAAWKAYLRVAEMQGDWRRAWLGVKLCARKLLQESEADRPELVQELDELATDRLLELYSTPKDASAGRPDEGTRKGVLKFLEVLS